MNLFKDAAVTALDLVGKLPDLMRAAKSDSIIEYTKPTRVEPLTIIEDRIKLLPYAHDLMQTLTTIYAGYYLQAVGISVNVGKIDVIRLLDKLNPERSPFDSTMGTAGYMMSTESYQHALPRPGKTPSLEAAPQTPQSAGGFGRDQVLKLQENTNLSVGKLLEVQVESCGHKATFPISLRLIVNNADEATLAHTLAIGSKDISMKARWHGMRSGQLKYIEDGVFCQDLIDEHRKALMRDTGFYAATLARRNKNVLSAIVSGQPSVATASNIVVISKDLQKKLEGQIGGRLSDFATRERIFKNTYVMLMVVVDPEWGHVTIYHRSLERPTELTDKELKSASKAAGPDIAEILKAYQLGNSPSF